MKNTQNETEEGGDDMISTIIATVLLIIGLYTVVMWLVDLPAESGTIESSNITESDRGDNHIEHIWWKLHFIDSLPAGCHFNYVDECIDFRFTYDDEIVDMTKKEFMDLIFD